MIICINYKFYTDESDIVAIVEDGNRPGSIDAIIREGDDVCSIMEPFFELNRNEGCCYVTTSVVHDNFVSQFEKYAKYIENWEADRYDEMIEEEAKAAEEAKANNEAWWPLDHEARLMGFRYRQ